MQEPFYFGPEDRQIFGVYHPALGASGAVLTVICPPLFSEFNRTYSALRNLALALVQKGQHVLRMEYSGTGESFGALADASPDDWVEEISLAIDEGRDLSGCRRVRLLGVRGSALLAARAAADNAAVDRLVLWDPFADGASLLRSLEREQANLLREHLYLDGGERRGIRKAFDIYPLAETTWDALGGIDASVYAGLAADKLRAVRTPKADDFAIDGVDATFVDFRCDWEIKNGEVFMCQPVLEALLAQLGDA